VNISWELGKIEWILLYEKNLKVTAALCGKRQGSEVTAYPVLDVGVPEVPSL
jgi:hypothetical protein